MALSLVNGQGGTAASGTTATYTVTATGSAAGTGLVLTVGWRIAVAASQTITSITDNKGNTWVKAVADNDATSTVKADIWYVDPASYVAGVTTLTVTFSIAASSGWWFDEASGMATSPPDATAAGHANSTAPTATTAALAQAVEFAVAGINYGSNSATISGLTAGWSLDTNQVATSPNATLAPAHQITAATAALTYAGTLSASNRWAEVVATFKASSGTSAALSGTDALLFGEAANPSMAAALSASDELDLEATATPSIAVSIQGTGTVAFSGTGSLEELVTGSGALFFGAVGTLSQLVHAALSGTAQLAFGSSAVLGAGYPGAGCSSPIPLVIPAYAQSNPPAPTPVLLGALALPPQPTAIPVLTGSQAGC